MRVDMAWSTTRSVACVWACTAATYPSGRRGCRGFSLKWRGTLGGAGIGENDTQGSQGARGVRAPVDGVDACAALVAHDLIDSAPAGQGAHAWFVDQVLASRGTRRRRARATTRRPMRVLSPLSR